MKMATANFLFVTLCVTKLTWNDFIYARRFTLRLDDGKSNSNKQYAYTHTACQNYLKLPSCLRVGGVSKKKSNFISVRHGHDTGTTEACAVNINLILINIII